MYSTSKSANEISHRDATWDQRVAMLALVADAPRLNGGAC